MSNLKSSLFFAVNVDYKTTEVITTLHTCKIRAHLSVNSSFYNYII